MTIWRMTLSLLAALTAGATSVIAAQAATAGVAHPQPATDYAGHPQADQRRHATQPAPRTGSGSETATPIRHLVVIFQENVSFDHYFGTYPYAANTDGSTFGAKRGTPTVNGLYSKITSSGPAGRC